MDEDTIRRLMEEKGLRPTKQRIAVYDFLLHHPIHPTAEIICRELQKAGMDFSRATVYNSLNKLAEVGLIKVLTIDAEEQRFDGTVADHGHFRCVQCGCVQDFPLDFDVVAIPYPADCEIRTRELFCSGFCGACRAPT